MGPKRSAQSLQIDGVGVSNLKMDSASGMNHGVKRRGLGLSSRSKIKGFAWWKSSCGFFLFSSFFFKRNGKSGFLKRESMQSTSIGFIGGSGYNLLVTSSEGKESELYLCKRLSASHASFIVWTVSKCDVILVFQVFISDLLGKFFRFLFQQHLFHSQASYMYDMTSPACSGSPNRKPTSLLLFSGHLMKCVS